MTRWLALIPVLAIVALGLLFAGYGLHHDPRVDPAALVGRPVPAMALAPLGGGAPVDLRRAGRQPVLINFFASWCAPCVVEHPDLMALKQQGVRIIGVAYKDPAGKTRAFLDRHGDPYAMILMDPDGRAGIEYGISGVPETFAVARGRVRAKQTGPLTPEAADRLIRAIEAR
jgi:cytochrome c biogenesis protein CcmG/thiol:disulfide interchange protein DsbE